jgi:histidine triad (HIT) family protein
LYLFRKEEAMSEILSKKFDQTINDTIFTKIINKEIPADILYEDELALAFSDINPQAPIHFLVIPKKLITTINDIQEDDKALVGHLYWVAAQLAEKHGFAQEGYRAVMNCNENGGQTVYHIHLHVLAGKAMGWPPYQDKLKTL